MSRAEALLESLLANQLPQRKKGVNFRATEVYASIKFAEKVRELCDHLSPLK
jgi:hypothetical protein